MRMPDLINTVAAPLPATGSARPGASAAELVKITQSLNSLLAVGESVDAEVVAVKPGSQNFELLLRLSLAGGGVATITASSNQPVTQGTQLLVSNLAGTAPLVTLQQVQSANVATLTQIDTQKLPVGTLLQGQVTSNQLLPQAAGQPAVYRAMVTLLNTALAGNVLTLDSPQPLRQGSLLSAQVQGSQLLNFVPLSGRMDQLAVSQQLATQQTRQGSIDGLLVALQSLQQSAELPQQARTSVERLLATLPEFQQMTDPKTVAQAMLGSGAFMEANLLNGQPAPDLKSALLRLVAQLTPGPTANAGLNPMLAATVLAQALPGRVRNALNAWGQVSEKPQPISFPLPARTTPKSEGDDDLEHLLRLAGAAVARLQSHQLAGLEQSGRSADGGLQTTWQLEIPMRHLNEFIPLQVKVQREEAKDEQAPSDANEPRPGKEKIWRVDLAFDLDPLGPLQVQAQLAQGSLSSQLWAERPGTAQLIEQQLDNLRERLQASGLTVADLQCHQGTAPQGPRTRLEQRWVDETA
jgi:hypothetical protein